MRILSRAPEETKKIAATLAKTSLKNKRKRGAFVFALTGNLGSGKTTFIQGFARGLGIKRRITSPTFLIIRSYNLKAKTYKLFYHIDAYRLKRPNELEILGFKEIAANPKNMVLVEWANKIKKILPTHSIAIELRHGRKPNERALILKAKK